MEVTCTNPLSLVLNSYSQRIHVCASDSLLATIDVGSS